MLSVAATIVALAIPIVPVNTHAGPCPALASASGCYYAATNDVWVKDPDDQATLAHELGHAWIAQRLNPGERHAFKCLPAMRSTFGDPQPCLHAWNEVTEEKAADAYADCLLGRVPSRATFINGHDYEPATDRRHLNLCRFIMRAD